MPQYPYLPSTTPATSSGLIKQAFSPASVIYSTTGNWSIAPSNLLNIMDGDLNTATTEGFVGGAAGYRGYINLVFPQIYQNCYGEFKLGARKDSGWANQKSDWMVEISQDNNNWMVAGGVFYSPLPSTEQIILGSISSLDGFRAIRFSCDDIGFGGSWLRVYSLNLFLLT